MLLAPALLLIAIGFVVPIGQTLYRSVDNKELVTYLPLGALAIRGWDGRGLPDEEVQAALAADLKRGFSERALGIPGRRLNLEITGFVNLLQTTGRQLAALPEPPASFTDTLQRIDRRWAEPRYWQAIKRAAAPLTDFYFLYALDLQRGDDGAIAQLPEERRLYLDILWRSLGISVVVTLICLVIAYPMAVAMADLRPRLANIALALVLLPFWTSVLVRTTAWLILLQREGLINGTLMSLGVITQPEALIFNRFGVIVALTHVLLPYMVLALYAVTTGVDPHLTRAARALGANPWQAFRRVYLPQTMPGIGAGCLLVFIIAIGAYVTPALVGGRHDQMISYFIAFNVNQTVNWGLAAALSTFLLAVVLALYPLYGRLAGIDRLKTG